MKCIDTTGKDVYPHWGHAELHDMVGLGEVLHREINPGEPELLQSTQDAASILFPL